LHETTIKLTCGSSRPAGPSHASTALSGADRQAGAPGEMAVSLSWTLASWVGWCRILRPHHGKHVLITVFSVVRLLGLGRLVGAICVWNER
ncbi:MAG: hypothetical protein WBX00_16485, partial [Isosphaeraceae bacterium]